MSVLGTLTAEHNLFRALTERLERGFKFDEETAREETRKTLLVLMPALQRHDELEDLVFGKLGHSAQSEKLLKKVKLQHGKLSQLRLEIQAMLNAQQQFQLPRLKDLIVDFAERLSVHFAEEETGIWPLFRQPSRSISHSTHRRAQKRVQDLEREIRRNFELISDYLGSRR